MQQVEILDKLKSLQNEVQQAWLARQTSWRTNIYLAKNTVRVNKLKTETSTETKGNKRRLVKDCSKSSKTAVVRDGPLDPASFLFS